MMNPSDITLMKYAEDYNKDKANLKREEIQPVVDDAYRNNGLKTDGPSMAEYDYTSAYEAGASLSVTDSGIDLPNGYMKPGKRFLFGTDIATGESMDGRANDVIVSGIRGLANSVTNTETGHPEQDVRPLATVARGTLFLSQEGGREVFNDEMGDWPQEQRDISWRAAERADLRETLTDRITTGDIPPAPDDIQEPTVEKQYSEDELVDVQGWMDSTKYMYEYLNDEPFTGTPEELNVWGLRRMAAMNWNIPAMAFFGGHSATQGQEFNKNLYNMMYAYENTSTEFDTVIRSVGALAADPTSYVGFGVARMGGYLAKREAMKWIKREAMKRAVIGGLAQAPVTGAFSTLDDAFRQMTAINAGEQKEFSKARSAKAGAAGAAFGAALPGAAEAGIATGKAISDITKAGFRSIRKRMDEWEPVNDIVR